MCNLSDGVEARGVRKGLEQGREQGRELSLTESIRNVMKNLGLSIEEAMKVLNIPEGEQPLYRELVNAN